MGPITVYSYTTLTVLLVHLPPRSTTSFGRSPVRTGGRPPGSRTCQRRRIHAVERLAQSTSRRGAAAYGDAHMVGTCRGGSGWRGAPSRRGAVAYVVAYLLSGRKFFLAKMGLLSFVARGRSPLLPPNTVGSRSAVVWEAAPRQEQPLRGWCGCQDTMYPEKRGFSNLLGSCLTSL